MSMMLMAKAFGVKVGSASSKLVLLKLADNANDQGECWPSYQHIADQCEMSRRSAMVHIEALCDSGFIEKRTRKGLKGNSSNVYIVILSGKESVAPSADSAPPSEQAAPPSADSAPTPSAESAPGISNSFEPVNESVKNNGPSDDEPAPDKKSPPKKFTEAEFDEFWETCRDNWHGRPGHKFEAKAEFKKLYRSEHDLERMKRLTLQECQARKAQHRHEGFAEAMKHVCRWIKVQGWEDAAENPTNVTQFRRPEQENRPYREAMPRPDRAPQRPTGTGGDV